MVTGDRVWQNTKNNIFFAQLKESGSLGMHGAHALQAATQVLEQEQGSSLEANHVLAAHPRQETAKVSPLTTSLL